MLRTRPGQILSGLVVLRALGALGMVPGWMETASTIGLWTWVAGFLLGRIFSLRTKLLWRIRRKLVISYLLIGLVPTLLILFFFLLSAFFIVGQVSSYVLNNEIQRIDADAVKIADLAVSELRGRKQSRARAYLADETIQGVLKERVAPAATLFPGAGAVYLEHRRGRIQRVVATEGLIGIPHVGTNLPPWIETGYHGPLRIASSTYFAGASSPVGKDKSESDASAESMTVLVLAPLEAVLDAATAKMGFHIDQVVASVADQRAGRDALVLDTRPREPAPKGGERPFTLPWLTLLQSRNFGEARDAKSDLIFVTFGFAPRSLYDGIAANALQLGPEGPDLGKVILWALALLAALFLVIEVSAIFVGLVLARSITGSVHALSQGTEHVRQGDFGYKVQVRSRDQLGELADSFNLMTTSIEDLLRQSAEKERLEEELRVARTIQMSLLPKERLAVPGLSIEWLCLPATEVGGDYCDFIQLEEGLVALLIADVSGKGTSAALYMAELKGLVLSLSRIYRSPRTLLIEANKILAANLDSRSFITMAYAVVDMNARKMTYARAGHNPIFHFSRNGRASGTRVLAPEGLGLALDRGGRFETILEEDSVDLSSGDVFLFFTDGVSEAMNERSELFGEDRLRLLFEENSDLSMDELRQKMIDEVFTFAGGAVQHDDMTMVLVKVL